MRATFNQEIFDEICTELANSDHGSLRKILASNEDRYPKPDCFYKTWVRSSDENGAAYQAAIDTWTETAAEQTIEISDDVGRSAQHNRNRIQARQWYIEKKNRKVWGNRVDLNHGGQTGNPMAALIAEVTGTSLLPAVKDEKDE